MRSKTFARAAALCCLGAFGPTSGIAVLVPIAGSNDLAFWDFTSLSEEEFTLVITSSAAADPIPQGTNVFVDNFAPPLSPWELNIDIAIEHLTDSADVALGDRVSLFIEAFHSRHPRGEGGAATAGDVYTATALFDFSTLIPQIGVPAGAGKFNLTDSRVVAHDNHSDRYMTTVAVPDNVGNQLFDWSIQIQGAHRTDPVPETGQSFLLLLAALGSVVAMGRRRRRANVGSEA